MTVLIEKDQLETVPGFPELLPHEQIAWQKMFDAVRCGFERFGYLPIETPAAERNQILTAKQSGDTTKEIYQLMRLAADEGEVAARDFSLHFDLTVPLARYVAQHANQLTFPFRRYQMQPVWRGERPSVKQGRFRQFYQCDIDVVGDGSLPHLYDAEIPAVIHEVFTQLNIGEFQIRINNRKLLAGFLEFMQISADVAPEVMRAVDKLEKQGERPLQEVLVQLGRESALEEIVLFLSPTGSAQEILSQLEEFTGRNETYDTGLKELGDTVSSAFDFGVNETRLRVDPGIARGLNYYTGTVYETALLSHPELGSVCSGGRYDDLATYFTDRKLPGVGISIGLSRIFYGLMKSGDLTIPKQGVAQVLVTSALPDQMTRYFSIATSLRTANIRTEVYLEKKALGKQMKYANKQGFLVAVIVHEDEVKNNQVTIKNMKTGTQKTVAADELIEAVLFELNGQGS